MGQAFQGFDTRLKAINRKRARLEHGYVGQINKDGLIVFRPKRRSASFPVRGLIYLLVGFIFFKAVIMAHLGASLYSERVAELAQGTLVEQAGSVIMTPDRASAFIAAKIRPILR